MPSTGIKRVDNIAKYHSNFWVATHFAKQEYMTVMYKYMYANAERRPRAHNGIQSIEHCTTGCTTPCMECKQVENAQCHVVSNALVLATLVHKFRTTHNRTNMRCASIQFVMHSQHYNTVFKALYPVVHPGLGWKLNSMHSERSC